MTFSKFTEFVLGLDNDFLDTTIKAQFIKEKLIDWTSPKLKLFVKRMKAQTTG